ncbi:ABC transporter permease [Helicobacter felis]|uniref:ABC-transporterpermease n=3 Tax=Helicobacter felis TaxID=214 RepID=E7A9A0_HELFC|nr:ABC transporter permease [Helicobacter felis]CBY82478.1 ABC-transporter;permease [Helicobacter felis ATCC 49179]
MRHIYHISLLEAKSYRTQHIAIFWTMIHPFLMLAFLIGVYEHTYSPDFRFSRTIGLVTLNLVSTVIFSLAMAMGMVLSRLMGLLCFSTLFVVGSFSVLGILPLLSVWSLLWGLLVLGFAGVFCSGLALIIIRYFDNTQNILAIGNMINLYAIMSANVFVPLQALPKWSQIFITSSPFYHLNNMLIAAFSGQHLGYVLGVSGALFGVGAFLIFLSAGRELLVSTPKSR